ncbi:hypothetical protein ACP70R_037289 [Stipagrostis hirtigluma subsp. patula]
MAISKTQRSSAKGGEAPPPAAAQPAGVADIDPKLEWLDGAAAYVIRLNLPGFKKEDFRVQVDAGGRLTVRGERPDGYVRFHKAFQLPPTANLDGVAGRFDGNVLSLTVPKAAVGASGMVAARMAEAKALVELEHDRAAASAEAGVGKGLMFAAAVAGFALGVFVAHRVFSATN